ncbi:MAG TPA: CBS domain-containing protein [Thermoanaerobaculia bacterium]|jgi:tRNA nucleotidyltransferase (CCA-adding enzyme)|nr:CBS domain-containing protein [Thermoanaerobaculia bacterium]
MELLSTHVGADFDGFAAMLVARRLHPEARLFFPGSREGSLRRMIEARGIEVPELRQRDVDPAALTRVILCDIRQQDRIGVVASWLEANPGIEVWAYDHHPASPSDLAVAGGIVDPAAGSSSTLLVEELRRRGLVATAEEADLLLMGIYEDTGSLTYVTTSPRDLQAAAWLLEQGGDLAAVRGSVSRPLDPERLDVLHQMTRRLEVHRIRGHRTGIVEVELGRYVEELAPLVSRCLEIFELPLLFALFGEGDRVTLIARGTLEGFDLGEALKELGGGGGHSTAASARFKETTLLEVRERLLEYLRQALPPAARARDLMIAPFYLIPAGTTVEEAKAGLNARRINAAPVEREGRIVGTVSRQVLDAALQHGLGPRPVETVMSVELEWVDPDAPADEVRERMLSRHPRFVMVGDPAAGRPLGLVTRMQLLRHLHGQLADFEERIDRHAERQRERREKIGRLMARRLPPALTSRIATIAAVSRELEVPVHLVGGFVRDLLLERENRDLDLVVEGDGLAFADALARAVGGRVRVHQAFLTAVVVDAEGFHVDVVTARSEFYRAPAALPEVQTSALRQDLFRRDFTINTLAIRLGPEPAPELIDYFGGRRDLKDRALRVLHSLSFIDDPTRILRAVRLELRLGFRISPETLHLAQVALAEGVFDRLSGSRLRDELALLLNDPDLALRGLERLAELGVLRALDPRIELDEAARERLRAARAAHDWYRLEGISDPPVEAWRLLLMALARGFATADLVRFAGRLMLAGEDRRLLTGFPGRLQAAREALQGGRALSPHHVAEILKPLSGEELLLLMAEGDESVRLWVRRYLTDLRTLSLSLRGADLLAAGIPPGPRIGEALRATLRARLDGRIDEGDELRYALAFLTEEPAVVLREETV